MRNMSGTPKSIATQPTIAKMKPTYDLPAMMAQTTNKTVMTALIVLNLLGWVL